mgnify:CR=1 FL=1
MNDQTCLSDEQVDELASSLVSIMTEFYADPKNEEGFKEWLQEKQSRSLAS